MRVYRVNTDGGARGNPGPAAIGAVIKNEAGEVIAAFGRAIGSTTNNVAEYQALIAALKYLYSGPRPEKIEFFLDSALVVNQVKGAWKVKQTHLRPLAEKARTLTAGLKVPVSFTAVPREKNREADALVNRALDKC